MQESKKKIILVTGGAGFIGSNLIEQLVKDQNNEVYSLDNYSTGSKDNHIVGATYIDGTFAVSEFCRSRGAKLVYAGSSTKFGDGGLGRDQSPYAWTKASNTELVKNYDAWFNLKHAITYFYNVYGHREISTGGFATVIGIFKEKSKAGKPLPVVTPGTQTRIFTNVDDIVRGLILVGEKGMGDGYGLGAEEEYSILDIAKLFGGEIEMLPERAGNRMTSSIDLSRSQGELGWKAEKSIKEYINGFLASLEK